MSGPVNTGFVLDMQRKLYRWSYGDAEKVFADLFNLVCDRRTLETAWQRLSRNKGSRTPGTDGVTRHKVEMRPGGVAGYLEAIRNELRHNTYRPEPVRQRLIPKRGQRGKYRPLRIPTLKDRLVQMALKLVLEPIFEADFMPASYGFRRGRSTHDALAEIVKLLHPSRHGPSPVSCVIEGDIKGCFDSIDHHVLMTAVRRRIGDRKVLRLVHAFLRAGVMVEGTVRHPVTGTPQGGIVSPLLANVYLSAIDKRYGRWTMSSRERPWNACGRRTYDRKRGRPTFQIVRYADDFVILVSGTLEQAQAERDALAEFLKRELRMDLSAEKTLITKVEDGFEFLGYRIVQERARSTKRNVGKLFIPKSKLQYLRDRIKIRTKRTVLNLSLGQLVADLNPIIVGWRNYYRYATGACAEFDRLDWWLNMRIVHWLREKHAGLPPSVFWQRYPKLKQCETRWAEDGVCLRSFRAGGTSRYTFRGTRIPNGWNADSDEWFVPGDVNIWEATKSLLTL
jgi:group II intron reverse transcriptase/maturase